jgi:putative Mg2+ transporter-C (MgtC) family protein
MFTPDTQQILIKLSLAVLLGGIIGLERELRSKSAGFRTLMLICVGATLFTCFSQLIGARTSPDRIASNVVVGIGFLGAGVIFRGDKQVNGITTAASIWVTAAVGMAIGGGFYTAAIIGCLLVLFILFVFSFLDRRIDRLNQVRDYKIVYPYEEHKQHKFEKLLLQYNLIIKRRAQSKTDNIITGAWTVQGNESNHHAFIETILQDDTVTSFDF